MHRREICVVFVGSKEQTLSSLYYPPATSHFFALLGLTSCHACRIKKFEAKNKKYLHTRSYCHFFHFQELVCFYTKKNWILQHRRDVRAAQGMSHPARHHRTQDSPRRHCRFGVSRGNIVLQIFYFTEYLSIFNLHIIFSSEIPSLSAWATIGYYTLGSFSVFLLVFICCAVVFCAQKFSRDFLTYRILISWF